VSPSVLDSILQSKDKTMNFSVENWKFLCYKQRRLGKYLYDHETNLHKQQEYQSPSHVCLPLTKELREPSNKPTKYLKYDDYEERPRKHQEALQKNPNQI